LSRTVEYYNLLSRTDHPVFKKQVLNNPNPNSFNSAFNFMIAVELAKAKEALDDVYINQYPHTTNLNGIDGWEQNYFNFSKTNKQIDQRVLELLRWINSDIRMSLPDVIDASLAIVGKEPLVIVSASQGSFILDKAILGESTILDAEDSPQSRDTYIVRFAENVSSTLLDLLDKRLTAIEKAGSKHVISSPPIEWVIGDSALDKDTILR